MTLTGLRATIAGFGLTYPPDRTYWNKEKVKQWSLKPLQIGHAAIVKCESYRTNGPFICVAPPCSNEMHTTLKGDSGGPLIVGNQIVGVLFGTLTGDIVQYTPVSPYLDWIIQVISNTS